MKLLKKLCEVDGIAGVEEAVRDLLYQTLEPLCEEIRTDTLGNVIARRGRRRGESPPAIMIAAHMDEIGFIVSHIDEEKGFLRLNPVGGFDPRTLVAQRVTVHSDSGPLTGVLGTKPVHIMTEAEKNRKPDIKRVFVDLGLPAKEVVEAVDLGDMVTLDRSFSEVGRAVTGKALDDRAGLWVMLEVMRRLGDRELDIEVFAVATVQEEVGLRGAQTSSFDVAPDLAIALDVTVASDVPDAKSHEYVTSLGEGVAIKMMDGSSICDRAMVKRLRSLAKNKEIAHQIEILPKGGSDTGAIQRSRTGVRTAALSIPTRYLHSTVEMAYQDDLEAAVTLLEEFLTVAHELA